MLLSIICFINEHRFSFGFHTNGLDMFYNVHLFGYAILKGDFIVLNLDNTYDNTSSTSISCFDSDSESAKWNAQLAL